MSAPEKTLETLIQRLETAIQRVEQLANQSGSTDRGQGTPSGNSATSNSTQGAVEDPSASSAKESPATKAFDSLCAEFLDPFLQSSKGIGSPVTEQAAIVAEAFNAQKGIISAAAQCTKPDFSSKAFSSLLEPLQTALVRIGNIKDENRASPLFNHLSAIADGIPAMGWVAVEKTPAGFVADMKDSAQFYGNRVVKEYKDKDAQHVQYIRNFLALLSALHAYIKKEHTTGLLWSAKGQPLESYKPATSTKAPSAGSAGPAGPP